MGTRNLDAYSLDDWRFACPDVQAMVRRRWRLQTVCANCSTRLWVSARTMALTMGPTFSPWGTAVACNRVGCDTGVRTFRAQIPELGRFIDLLGPRGYAEEVVAFNVSGSVVTEKPRSLR
ncbi:MAG: hypothetical protein EON59_01735 [Alphaproteobacteria bacterium]|nr:MAG: hypothetical protein EON59_01735 [Alphaproteobacteria bacterium]